MPYKPKYRRLYANEGNVSDDVRELHPYLVKDIAKYRQRFNVLYKQMKDNEKAEKGEDLDENIPNSETPQE